MPSRGSFEIEARLKRDASMSLAVNGRTVARGRAAGLIPAEPLDGLSLGEDTLSNVGAYTDREEHFQGTVDRVKIEPGNIQ
jgi:hypothetical protein